MQLINDIEQLTTALEKRRPVLIYFSGEGCSVCQAHKPKIATAIADNFSRFEIYQVKADYHREIASQFMVFSIPTILVYFDNKLSGPIKF
ncbi:MAG: thioredoxin family protein [Gammaproteobacteria bacterium]|nr:thioredoxin family protein [Gammaproteobacteria bacterium]